MKTIRRFCPYLVSVALVLGSQQLTTIKAQSLGDLIIEDIFGRRLNDNGIVLVDWEGYMANPAIKVLVRPPADAQFPATAVLTSSEPRLYFALPSEAGPNGPRKTITFTDASAKVPVLLSIFPDRDTFNEDHLLKIQLTDANGLQSSLDVNVHVIDQDRRRPRPFRITVNFSKDQTGLFADPQKRGILRQAAKDWAYFIADMKLDTVPPGAETTFIWNPDGFVAGTFTINRHAYTGFLLYAYGIQSAALRSGGEASLAGGLQSSGGVQLPLRRSGGVEIEMQGNFNTLGWFLTLEDSDWWKASNLANEPNDLYSIAHHEMGHALFFNPAYPMFAQAKAQGFLSDPALLAYHGSYPNIDVFDHFSGEIDNASQKGAFGYEYFGDVPPRRWLITKLDLLSIRALGYRLRQTSAFVPLSIRPPNLLPGVVSSAYLAKLRAKGGIPFYYWTIESGALPDGLSLNSFTGAISGTPAEAGTFNFTVRVQDYQEGTPGVSRPLSITIDSGGS